MTTDLSGLVADVRRDRLRAIRSLPAELDADAAFALRRLLFTDRDAHVRAAAARSLAGWPGAEPWLLERITDRTPLVRDAIVRSLARCGTSASSASVRALVERDGVWWVRRAACYALAALPCGEVELATFTRTLADPFWRVRQAAVRVLSLLGARDPDVRDVVLATPPSPTVAFLRGTWGPVAVEAPARATAPSLLPPALLDPDPAVVTARVPRDRDATPLALVELLCDPHAPLRDVVVSRLVEAGDIDAFEAALDWLEEPRIPHVGDTVRALLDSLGDPALAVAERALRRTDRPAAAAWAIDWIVHTRAETLYDLAVGHARASTDPEIWRAALPLVDDAELAADSSMSASLRALLLDDIATELHGRCAFDELLLLDGSSHPRVRALQIDAAARRRDWDVVERATHDEDHGPRAIAARWLVRRGCADAAGFLSDTDPTVREAALSGIVAEHGAAPLAAAMAALDDRDPSVRRMATRAFVLASRSFAAPSTTANAPDIDTIVRAAAACFAATDPFLRRIACELPLDDDRVLAHVIERTGDDDAGVRSAAAGALDRRPDLDPRVRALAESTSLAPGTRTLAYSWLLRRLDDDALALARAAYDRETDSDVRTLLLGIASAISAGRDEPSATPDVDHEREAADRAPAPHIEPAPFVEARDPGSAHVDAVERRPFGRAGFDVAPLAISGAFDLPREGLELAADAGVDLYFWEPGYDLLGRFLRGRDRLRVITGTYHADAASIRADVERALRTLRREALDAFLLFWTRSPARVDDAAYRVLDQLKREGKLRAIGFSTHFRELARDAIAERPWDVVMIRHSAAHPGVETELLPAARAAQTAIVTFSALTYGRMTSGAGAPTPAECYRYSLAQPGVTACISAPRRIDELAHNLGALAEPRMPEDRVAELRAFGLGVRAESARVNTLLRQPTRDAAAAAREMLASEPAPSSTELRVPAASAARRSRARLGGRRRR